MGKYFTKIRYTKYICPKWANASRQFLGNQFDRGSAIDFHASHTVLDQVIGHTYIPVSTQ